MTTIYRYEIGFDLAALPASRFIAGFNLSGGAGFFSLYASDIAAQLVQTKCLLSQTLRTIYVHGITNPESTVTQSAWPNTTFLAAIEAAALIKSTAAGWTTHLHFAISSSGIFTISTANGSTLFRFSPDTLEAMELLGFANATTGYATSHTGIHPSKYAIIPTIAYTSKDSGLYEAESISTIVQPCIGVEPVGNCRGYSPIYHDFSHVGEPKSNIWGNTYGTVYGNHPCGWNVLFSQCRKGLPFVSINSAQPYNIYYLREGSFKPIRMVGDYNDLYEVQINAIRAGYLST